MKRGVKLPPIPPNDDLLRQLWATDLHLCEIGKQLGASKTWVSDRARRIGLPARQTKTRDLPAKLIVAAYEQGWRIERIRLALLPKFPLVGGTTIRRVLKAHKVKLRPAGKVVPGLHTECVRLVRAGKSCREAGRILGLKERQVAERARSILGPRRRGSWTLPKFDVKEAMAMRSRGVMVKEIAARFNVTSAAISYHWRKRNPA